MFPKLWKSNKKSEENRTVIEEALKKAWATIPVSFFENLVKSIKQRVQACIDADGWHTKYWTDELGIWGVRFKTIVFAINLVWTELNYNCFWFCNLIKRAADLFLIFVIFGCGLNFGSVTVMYRLKTVLSKKIHLIRVTYSWLLSYKLFGLFLLFKTIQYC
jgi:hypothetical protein